MQSAQYFFAMFGDPNPPEKDEVESGAYHPNQNTAPYSTQPGDFLLLYCTGGYAGLAMQAPGIGIVLAVDYETARNGYVPLTKP